MKTLCTVLLVCFVFALLAQNKTEIERRIDKKEAPTEAQEWMDEVYKGQKKTKWYYESLSGDKSFEAKLKWGSELHRVTFLPDGTIQGIGIDVSLNDIPENTLGAIKLYLDSTYTKHSIQKVVKQWTGSPDILKNAIELESKEKLVINYEIEFYGKKNSEEELWAGVFDAKGILRQRRKIELRPADNLQY